MRKLLPLVLVALVLGAGCQAPPEAVSACDVYMGVNAGHVLDAKLPLEARLVALDNYDAWAVQRFSLTGDAPPAEVAARVKKAREALSPPPPPAPKEGK